MPRRHDAIVRYIGDLLGAFLHLRIAKKGEGRILAIAMAAGAFRINDRRDVLGKVGRGRNGSRQDTAAESRRKGGQAAKSFKHGRETAETSARLQRTEGHVVVMVLP